MFRLRKAPTPAALHVWLYKAHTLNLSASLINAVGSTLCVWLCHMNVWTTEQLDRRKNALLRCTAFSFHTWELLEDQEKGCDSGNPSHIHDLSFTVGGTEMSNRTI